MKGVRTTVVVKGQGVGTLYEESAEVRPGDTFIVTVEVPVVIEVNNRPVTLIHNGKRYRIQPQPEEVSRDWGNGW